MSHLFVNQNMLHVCFYVQLVSTAKNRYQDHKRRQIFLPSPSVVYFLQQKLFMCMCKYLRNG